MCQTDLLSLCYRERLLDWTLRDLGFNLEFCCVTLGVLPPFPELQSPCLLMEATPQNSGRELKVEKSQDAWALLLGPPIQ